ncbi:MAG: sulfatase-like hydrolase/transferase [Cyclobacteriaceae bacterium]
MKYILYLVGILTIIGCQSEKEKEAKPNIVLLFTDDQTYASINALGNKEVSTPNMDRLVNEGVTFVNAFNMGGWNGAVCIASRSMMNSGRSVWRAYQLEQDWKAGEKLDETLGSLLRSGGYNTYMTGKWHIQAPSDSLFDIVKHERPGMPGDRWGVGGEGKHVHEAFANGEDLDAVMPIGYNRPKHEDDTSWLPDDPSHGGFWEGGKHWSEVVKENAISFISDASDKTEPFFMYLAFNAPHDPRQAPREFVDMYDETSIAVPESFMPEYTYKDDIGNGPTLRDEALAPFPRTEYAVRVHRKEYYALISHLDHQIGEILEALKASGKMENTYVFFTSDHGLSVGNHGLIGKQNMFDHSIRVPLMVMGPGIEAGGKRSQDVYLQDVMASSLELAGVPKPSFVEFNSLMSIIADETKKGSYNSIYGCYVDYQRMIRKDGFKLIVYPQANKVLLFDLENDPNEMNDLSGDPDHRDMVKALFSELLDIQHEKEDPLDLSDMYNQWL